MSLNAEQKRKLKRWCVLNAVANSSCPKKLYDKLKKLSNEEIKYFKDIYSSVGFLGSDLCFDYLTFIMEE